MSNTLGKNLHLCFSIIKRPQHQITNNNSPKHSLSNHHHHHNHQHYPSPPPPPPPYTKNYNSLFEDITCLAPITTTATTTYASASASASSVSDTDTDMADAEGPATPDLTAAYASRRFFISSPGRSNSIVDSLSPEEDSDHPSAVAGGVAVETYSPDPYVDFRRSMQEMVEAREVARGDVTEAWQYLQELLLSYLSLNPKGTHKYIVRAFADLVVSSMSPNNNINININNDDNNNNNNGASSSSSPSFSSYYGLSDSSDHNNSAYVEIFNNAT